MRFVCYIGHASGQQNVAVLIDSQTNTLPFTPWNTCFKDPWQWSILHSLINSQNKDCKIMQTDRLDVVDDTPLVFRNICRTYCDPSNASFSRFFCELFLDANWNMTFEAAFLVNNLKKRKLSCRYCILANQKKITYFRRGQTVLRNVCWSDSPDQLM